MGEVINLFAKKAPEEKSSGAEPTVEPVRLKRKKKSGGVMINLGSNVAMLFSGNKSCLLAIKTEPKGEGEK